MQARLTQPKGFSVFFLTEMWERFGFNILQVLLVLFLSQKFLFNDKQCYAILGSFTALAYIMPIVGGYIADSALGYRHSVIIGSLLLSFGYASLAFSTDVSQLYLSIAIVTVGTGLLKPNISSLLGTLYSAQDPRRDAGYTLFYVGINVGSLLATLLGGYIQRYLGWYAAYGCASIVLIIGCITFTYGTWKLRVYDLRQIQYSFIKYLSAYLMIALLIAFSCAIIQHEQWSLVFFGGMCTFVVIIIAICAYHEEGRQRRRVFAYFLLLLISVVFWALFFQVYFSLNLFVSRVLNHDFFGINLPTPGFLALESIGIILFGPVLSKIWTTLNRNNHSISIPAKFTLGIFFVTVTFLVLYASIFMTPAHDLVFSYWLILAYFVLALGELSLSPIGLAMVIELSPPRTVGMMMGIFFVTLGVGGKLAGILADYSAIPTADIHDIVIIKSLYQHAFLYYAEIAAVATVAAILITPFIRRLIKREINNPVDMPQL